jgi:hypothetical protein
MMELCSFLSREQTKRCLQLSRMASFAALIAAALGAKCNAVPVVEDVTFEKDALVVARSASKVVEGPDRGAAIDEGLIAVCSKIQESRLWISGPRTGWVEADSFLSIGPAEAEWQRRCKSSPTAKDIAVLANIQVQLGEDRLARDTINTIGNSVQANAYVRTVQAIVSAHDSEVDPKNWTA